MLSIARSGFLLGVELTVYIVSHIIGMDVGIDNSGHRLSGDTGSCGGVILIRNTVDVLASVLFGVTVVLVSYSHVVTKLGGQVSSGTIGTGRTSGVLRVSH